VDNFSPHCPRWQLSRLGLGIHAQCQALRSRSLDGTDHASQEEQNSVIRTYTFRRTGHAPAETLRELVKRANVA
jgi:hypothetical protein